MPATVKGADVRRVRHDLGELLGDGEDVGDAAVAERLGAAFLAMGQVPGAGPELAAASLEALEAAGGARGAAVLAAMAVLARPPLAEDAGASLERLHLAGVRSSAEGEVGTLVVEEARRLALGTGEVLVALLRRPAAHQVQAAMVIVEHEKTGGAAVGGSLSPPGSPRSLRRALAKMAGVVAGGRSSVVSPGDLTEALRRAFARSAEAGLAVPFDLGMAAPILARALTGDAGAFAPVVVNGSHELPLDPEDDEELDAATEELARHLVEVNEGDPVVERSGPFVAQTMCDYKWRYGDRRLGSWTTADLDEYLLDYFPRKVCADDELVRDAPPCAVAFLTMLDDHDALEGASVRSLGAHVEAITEQFRRAVSDRRRWGPAKSAMTAMLDDGVDPEDEDAVAEWIDAVNAGADLWGAGPRRWSEGATPPHGGPRSGGRAAGRRSRAKQRKTARAARRRNRR